MVQEMKLVKYIKNTSANISETKETLFFGVNVFIKDVLPENISINNVLKHVEKIIPSRFVEDMEAVYVGRFPFMDQRAINAMYEGGTLYISNEQDNDGDMIDDIVHEIAHCVEEKYGEQIYEDGLLQQEFLLKRKKIYDILKAYEYPVTYQDFMNSEYDQNFDMFLYDTIGYDKLEHFSMGLFLNNYSITSLREYFAVGFESYFLNNKREVSSVSPILYKKIQDILKSEY